MLDGTLDNGKDRRIGERRESDRRRGDRRRIDRRQVLQWPGEAPPQELVDDACDKVFDSLLIVEQEKMRQEAVLRFPLSQRTEVEGVDSDETANNAEMQARLTKYTRQAVLKHHTADVIEVLLEDNPPSEGEADGEEVL